MPLMTIDLSRLFKWNLMRVNCCHLLLISQKKDVKYGQSYGQNLKKPQTLSFIGLTFFLNTKRKKFIT